MAAAPDSRAVTTSDQLKNKRVSMRLAAIIYLCVPLSIVGGVGMLYLLGLPFSISAGVGFIALFGIAVLNGLVMVGAIRKFEIHGLPLREAVLAGADERLRALQPGWAWALAHFRC